MNSGRMKKLAGIINKEYTRFNDYFEIDRYNLPEDSIKQSYLNTPIRDGNWCKYEDVAELEEIARQMYDILNELVETMDDLPESDETPQTVWDVYREARKVIEKVKSL